VTGCGRCSLKKWQLQADGLLSGRTRLDLTFGSQDVRVPDQLGLLRPSNPPVALNCDDFEEFPPNIPPTSTRSGITP